MNNQQAVVDQIVQNLAFEVEAVPKDRTIRSTSISQSTPLNVKIRVRKKDETQTQHEVSSLIDEPVKGLQKVRLVSSDQTIMTFDVFMEAEFEKKPLRKPRKKILDILKPGLCLGAMDDDDQPYMPSSSYSARITEPTVTTRSDGVLKQKFTLSKNNYEDYRVSHHSDGPKWLFGRCKPGGCLDPPFSEDKYSYKPSLGQGQLVPEPNILRRGNLGDEDVKDEVKSNGRRSSIFDSGLFKRRRKSSDKSTNTLDVKEKETDSILSIYQGESTVNSLSTHSNNSIITYPPERTSLDKTVRGRGPSEDKPRMSFNEHSEPYFIPPKGINRLKEKDPLNQKDYRGRRSSDVSDIKIKSKDYLKMPVPLPIPLPIPMPIKSDQHKPGDEMQKQNNDDDTGDTESSLDKIKPNDTQIPERYSKTELSTDYIDQKPIESFDEDAVNLDTDEKNESKTKEQQDKDMDDEYSPKDTAISKKEIDKQPIILPIPIPISFSGSKSEIAANITKLDDPNAQTSDKSVSKISQTEQLWGTNTSNQDLKDTTLEGSKILQKDVSSNSNENGRSEAPTTKSQYSEANDKETEVDPKNIFRTRSSISLPSFNGSLNERTGVAENIVTKEPTMQADIKHVSKDKKEHEDDIETTENDIDRMGKENDPDLLQTDDSQRTSQLYKPVPQTAPLITDDQITSSVSKKSDKGEDIGNALNDGLNDSRITNNRNLNFITAPVTIEPAEPKREFGEVKRVYSEISLVTEPEIPGFQFFPDAFGTKIVSRFKADDDDTMTYSTISNEVIGTKSVIYDADGFLPSAASVKPSERLASSDKRVILFEDADKGSTEIITRSPRISNEADVTSDELRKKVTNKSNARSVSVLSSTSTLKSALKKDSITVELAFQSYLNDKNERVIRTFDAENKPKRLPNDSVTVIKSQIRLSSNEIRIPVDSDHDMSIQIKKPNTNQRVSLSESTLENGVIKQKTAIKTSVGEGRNSATKGNEKISENVADSNVIDLYEQELVPLQMIIKKLRDEIDVLAAQQLMFRDKVFCPKKSKLPRLVHNNKKCFGCLKK